MRQPLFLRRMQQREIQLSHKTAQGYVVPFGPVNLVAIRTDAGLIGCGLVDIAVLERFGFPAAQLRAKEGPFIVTLEDLLNGIVKGVNPSGEKKGIVVGMTGREALELL